MPKGGDKKGGGDKGKGKGGAADKLDDKVHCQIRSQVPENLTYDGHRN
jgi:hypothetical protein